MTKEIQTTRARSAMLWAAIAALALSISACGAGGGGETTLGADAGPHEVLEAAGLRGVHSGRLYAGVGVNKLKKKESISISFDGSFRRLGEADQPQAFATFSAQGNWRGRKTDVESLLVALPEGAMVSYGSEATRKPFELEPSTVRELRSKLDQAEEEGGEGDPAACLDAAGEFSFVRLVQDPKIEDRRQEPDGTRVVVVSGPIDLPRLHDLVVRLARDPACGTQMKALGLPSAVELEGLKIDFRKGFEPRLKLAVDRHGVIHELVTRFECARLNGELFELQLNFSLSEVNRQIEVESPIEGEPLDVLLRKLGTSLDAVLSLRGSEAVMGFLNGLGKAMSGHQP